MKINAAEFRKNCLKLINEVNTTHTEVIITKHGKPLAKLVYFEERKDTKPFIGSLKGVGKTIGDLTEPVQENWEID